MRAAEALGTELVRVRVYDGLARLPHFNPDLETSDSIPADAADFRDLVGDSAGLIISCPEYAHGIPGSLKNALDWLVEDERFAGKPVALWNAAPRAVHAPAQLREILSTMAARIVEDACLTLELGPAGQGAATLLAAPDTRATLSRALAALGSFAAHRVTAAAGE